MNMKLQTELTYMQILIIAALQSDPGARIYDRCWPGYALNVTVIEWSDGSVSEFVHYSE